MRAWVSHGAGLDRLRLEERPVPRPAAGQVLLRMRAATVALREHKMAIGAYGSEAREPFVLGGEGVGEVVEWGEGVQGWREGQRVNPLFVQRWTEERVHPEAVARSALGGPSVDGCLAEYMVVPAGSLVAVPEHLSDAQAATLPCAGAGRCAWSARWAPAQRSPCRCRGCSGTTCACKAATRARCRRTARWPPRSRPPHCGRSSSARCRSPMPRLPSLPRPRPSSS